MLVKPVGGGNKACPLLRVKWCKDCDNLKWCYLGEVLEIKLDSVGLRLATFIFSVIIIFQVYQYL